MKKAIKWLFMIVGGLAGYEVFLLLKKVLQNVEMSDGRFGMDGTEEIVVGATVILFFISVFYRLAPVFIRGTNSVANRIETGIRKTSPVNVIGGAGGILAGLVLASTASIFYRPLIVEGGLSFVLNIIVYAFCGVIGYKVGIELFAPVLDKLYEDGREFFARSAKEQNANSYNPKDKKNQRIPKILDTSVIIDGRIQEIMKSGFFEGPVVIPEFVLLELQHISDSSDNLKRAKGRRGLDILKKMQDDFGLEIYNTENEKSLKDIPEVDIKLLKLAQMLKGKVVTNDFNLNKVAQVKGIGVLNINELANAIKPIVIPGEEMNVTLVKQGKDRKQAIGYLDDGTMIVVEDAIKHIGENVNIAVTSVIQTQAGRMIFGRIK
ncbi:MAG: PIN domain-containing protein [Clostridia bacterium]|nr:PIN domain-containing protein [Clostridia bacterium]